MTTAQEVSPIRGAIRTSVSTSTEGLVAAENFSIFVTIQNPFEVPLVVHTVSAHLPTEFIDVDQRLRELQAIKLRERISEIEEAGRIVGLSPSATLPRRQSRWPSFLRGISLSFFGLTLDFQPENPLAPAIARDLSGGTSAIEVGLSLPFIGSVTSTIKGDLNGKEDQEQIKKTWREQLQKEIDKYQNATNSLESGETISKTLQAGNSTTRVFTLRSKQGIWFKPSSYKLHIEVEYEIAGLRNVDTIEYAFQIKASLGTIIIGAIIGGIGGWLANRGEQLKNFAIADWIGLGVSLVLAAMAVVLFARKKDVQPLIAIEDFWGGIAIGFLVAYSGPQLLKNLLTTNTAPAK